jgi:hypothetical protein
LSKTKDTSKSKEERLKEKEKADAETQRSLAVAEMKKAHKLIEDTEKMRKRPVLQSICSRMEVHVKVLDRAAAMYAKHPFGRQKILADNVMDNIMFFYQTYESILFDFQKNMKIGDEEMNRLFPKIEMKTESGFHVSSSFNRIIHQLTHMKIYCMRLLS